jgi:hypothetical protein
MADNLRQFNRKIEAGDVSVEGRQANGITADDKGNVFLYSGLKNSELKSLTEDQFDDNIPFYYGNSYIAVVKSQTHDNLVLGNQKWDLDQKDNVDPNKITTTNDDKVDCNNEFNDASEILLNWENYSSNVASTGIGKSNKFKYLGDAQSNPYKGGIDINGWDPYGANGTGILDGDLKGAQNYFKTNYWDSNNKNTGDFSIAQYAGSNSSNPKLIINNLPPGLRIQAAQLNYNTKQWWTRILVAVGPDFLDIKGNDGKSLGIPYKQSINITSGASSVRVKDTGIATAEQIYFPNTLGQTNFILGYAERIQKFIDQYDDIIKAYNNKKDEFISALYNESIRYYKARAEGKLTDLKYLFWSEYAKKAKELAIKYKDCPPSPPIIPQQQSNQQETTQKEIPVKGIMLGDSLTPLIHSHSKSKNLDKLGPEGVRKNGTGGGRWGIGWSTVQLGKAISLQKIDDTVTHVFLSMGTNGTFLELSTKISSIVSSLKVKYPNAKIYIVQGTYGSPSVKDGDLDYFGNKIIDIKERIKKYYQIWSDNKVEIINNPPIESPIHPDNSTPGIKTAGKAIDEVLNNAKPLTQQVTIDQSKTDLPNSETQTDQPATKIEEVESINTGNLEYLPEEDNFAQASISFEDDGLTRHDENSNFDENSEYQQELNKTNTTSIISSTGTEGTGGTGGTGATEELKQKVSKSLLAYLQHNQGEYGIQTVLYYTFKEPLNKIPINTLIDNGKKKKVKIDLNDNMYGINLYKPVGTKLFKKKMRKYGINARNEETVNVGNVGSKDFKKNFGDDKDTSYTPVNFLKWWIAYWKEKEKEYKAGSIPTKHDVLFQKAAKKYNVPFEQIKLTSYVESSLVETSGNGSFEGLFAISLEYFNDFWSNPNLDSELKEILKRNKLDIHNAELNTYAGVALFISELKNSDKFLKLYVQ